MARPHHRKKHKQQLQHFKHRGDTATETAKTKGSNVFAVGGGFFGLAIGYIASAGGMAWMIGGLVLGATLGYFIGKKVDEKKEKK